MKPLIVGMILLCPSALMILLIVVLRMARQRGVI